LRRWPEAIAARSRTACRPPTFSSDSRSTSRTPALWIRLATLVGVGLALLALAVRRYAYELPTALYMLLAVLSFWMAIVAVM
jgi:hypothetical protein